jgi:hypothetical protein
MDTTGHHIDVSTRERVTALMALLAEVRGRPDTGAIGGIDRTDWKVRPDITNLSENILLAHYQRERR